MHKLTFTVYTYVCIPMYFIYGKQENHLMGLKRRHSGKVCNKVEPELLLLFFIKIYGPFAFCCCLVWTTSAHWIHLFVYLCFMCRERNIAVQRESSNNRSIFCMEKATTKMAKKIWCTSIISITHYRVTTLTHLLTLLPDLHASTLRATFLHHIHTLSSL